MRVLLPYLFLLGAISAAPAQFTPADPVPPTFKFPTTPYDSRTQLPLQWQSQIDAAKARAQALAALQRALPVIVAQNNSVCYALRSYNFAQEDSSSDRTTYKGSSTCEPAKDTHLRAIAVPASR